jgi:uncharacterized lipoprotein YajG
MLRDSRAIRISFLLAITLLVAGCGLHSFQPQHVTLAPRLSTAPVKIGAGAKVYITVADERGTNFLGYKADSDRFGRGNITTSDDIRVIYQKALSDGLANLGFKVVTAPDPAALNLEVSIRRFLYMGPLFNTATGSTGKANETYITAATTARVRRGRTEALDSPNVSLVHEKSYEVYLGHPGLLRPSPSEVEEKINAALSELIAKLLDDLELLALLKARGTR